MQDPQDHQVDLVVVLDLTQLLLLDLTQLLHQPRPEQRGALPQEAEDLGTTKLTMDLMLQEDMDIVT